MADDERPIGLGQQGIHQWCARQIDVGRQPGAAVPERKATIVQQRARLHDRKSAAGVQPQWRRRERTDRARQSTTQRRPGDAVPRLDVRRAIAAGIQNAVRAVGQRVDRTHCRRPHRRPVAAVPCRDVCGGYTAGGGEHTGDNHIAARARTSAWSPSDTPTDSPLPSAENALPSHFAMCEAATPPAVVEAPVT